MVEPSAEFASNARELAAAREGVRVVKSFLKQAPAELHPRGFDFIVLSGLLHEADEPQQLLQAATPRLSQRAAWCTSTYPIRIRCTAC